MRRRPARCPRRTALRALLCGILLGPTPVDARVHTGARSVEWSLGDGIVLSLEQVPFQAAGHRITRKGAAVIRIDGQRFWGTDGDLPRCQLKSARARIGQGTFDLPVEGLFEPLLSARNSAPRQCAARRDKTGTRIRCDFSDMKGAYRVIWTITGNGAMTRRVEEIA